MTAVRRVDQGMAAAAAAMLLGRISDELRTRYRRLPVMVRTAGLAATYAFLVAKSDEQTELGRAYAKVADGIRSHLIERRLVAAAADGNPGVLAALAGMEPQDYARAAAEAEALAGWLSRLAEAKYEAAKTQAPEQDR